MKLRIGFVGSPYSGKTTTAAYVFAELKRMGYAAEFLPEYAREHIRGVRARHVDVTLGNDDQHEIMVNQLTREDDILDNSGEEVILVTDGSTVNAFFYVEGEEWSKDRLREHVNKYDILFFSRNIEIRQATVDANRVHTEAFSHHTDDEMLDYFQSSRSFLNVKHLEGDIDTRVAAAMTAIGRLLLGRELAKAHRQ